MPNSRAQLRLAHEVVEGRSNEMPKPVAKEMVKAFHGRKMSELPEHSGKARTRKALYGE